MSSLSSRNISQDERLKVGDSFKDNALVITVKSAEEWKDYSQYDAPDAGKKYIRIFVQAENTGTSNAAFIYSGSFKCYADNKLGEDYIFGDDTFKGDNLSAGRITEGYIYYEIPSDAQKIEIEYETNFITDKKVYFDIDLNG